MRRRRITTHLTYANVAATVALVLAAGTGGAYAVSKLTKNSVRSKNIAPGQVKRSDLGRNSVNSAKIANGSIRPQDLGAAAKDGAQGPPGPPGAPGQDLSYVGIRIGGAFVRTAAGPNSGNPVDTTLGSFEGIEVFGRCYNTDSDDVAAEIRVRAGADDTLILGAGSIVGAGSADDIAIALTEAGNPIRVPAGGTVRTADGRVYDVRSVAVAQSDARVTPLIGAPGEACGFIPPGIERVSG